MHSIDISNVSYVNTESALLKTTHIFLFFVFSYPEIFECKVTKDKQRLWVLYRNDWSLKGYLRYQKSSHNAGWLLFHAPLVRRMSRFQCNAPINVKENKCIEVTYYVHEKEVQMNQTSFWRLHFSLVNLSVYLSSFYLYIVLSFFSIVPLSFPLLVTK